MPETPSRFRTGIWVLIILLPVTYLLGAGPANYLHSDLPPVLQRPVELMYVPLPWLLYEQGLADTWVGGRYMSYLAGTAELKEQRQEH